MPRQQRHASTGSRLLLLAAGLALSSVACGLPERELTPLDGEHPVARVRGRLMVQPNPVLVAMEAEGSPLTRIQVWNDGSEPLTLLSVRFEGMDLGDIPTDGFPVSLGMAGDWFSFAIYPRWPLEVEQPMEGVLVFETDDPDVPTVVVPLIGTPTSQMPYDIDPWADTERSIVFITPNPIRLAQPAVGDPVLLEVEADVFYDGHWVRVTAVEPLGNLLQLARTYCQSPGDECSALPVELTREVSRLAAELTYSPAGSVDATDEGVLVSFENFLGERYAVEVPLHVE